MTANSRSLRSCPFGVSEMHSKGGISLKWFACLFISSFLVAVPVSAQPQRLPNRPRTESNLIAEIMEQLSSPDAAQRQQGLEAVRQRMNTRGLVELRSIWLKALLNARQYEEAANLAAEGILSNPWETKSIEPVMAMRIKALLALGKNEEALGCAKSLFNVESED